MKCSHAAESVSSWQDISLIDVVEMEKSSILPSSVDFVAVLYSDVCSKLESSLMSKLFSLSPVSQMIFAKIAYLVNSIVVKIVYGECVIVWLLFKFSSDREDVLSIIPLHFELIWITYALGMSDGMTTFTGSNDLTKFSRSSKIANSIQRK